MRCLDRDSLAAIATCLVAALVATTALRIEVLNRAAGGVMPRTSPDDGKWRESLMTTEAWWRRLHGIAPGRNLTGAETQAMATQLPQNRANNRLRSIVRSWGLAQYVLVPALSVAGIYLLVRARGAAMRCCGTVAIAIAILAGWSLVHRQYWASLGW